jgi:hypothetical protein
MKVPVSQSSPHVGGATTLGASRPERPHDKGDAKDHQNAKSRDSPYPFGDRVISLPEASAISGLSIDTLRRCHKREELKIVKLSPRRCGIRLSTLWAFIDSRAA